MSDGEKLYDQIINAVPEGIWVANLEGETIFCNERMAELLGTTAESLEKLTCFDTVFPSDLEHAQRHFKAQMAGGARPFDFRLRRLDGSPIWVRISCMPMHDAEGAVKGLLGLFTDITERRQAEIEVRESEERFRNMADAAPVMIWVSGTDKLCTFFNKPWLEYTGRTIEQELGNGWTDGVHPEDLVRCIDTYCSSFDRRCAFRMEYRLRRANGEYGCLLDTGTPLYKGSEFVGYIGSCIDITEFKRNQQFLEEYRQQLQKLTAGLLAAQESQSREIAREFHDGFSQELMAIGLQIHSLEAKGKARSDIVRSLSRIREAVGRLATDMHNISRQLHPAIVEELGLEAALRQECEQFQGRFGISTHFTVNHISDQLSKEVSLCLYRVAQESLRNIGKHAVDASRVSVSLSGSQREVILVVKDTGGGFKRDLAKKNGGLGLISMDERIRLVRGELAIQSELGKGTTVTVVVPTTESNPPRARVLQDR
jgi:PAS domain S-box-containing protein